MMNQKNNKWAVVGNVISTIVLVFSVIVCVLVIASMKSSTGVASIFGYTAFSVQSDSMEPVFFKDDLILIKCSETTDKYQVGDIISFYSFDKYGTRFVNTHRVVKVLKGETRERYITKGDNAPQEDTKKLGSSNILGRYTGKCFHGLGKVVDFVNSPTGVLLCVVIPSAIIIVWQVLFYLKNSRKQKEQMMREAEERARDERIRLVRDVMAANNGGTPMQSVPPLSGVSADVQGGDVDKQAVIQDFIARQKREDADKQLIIQEYLQQQAAEEAKKQAIIEEYLQKQKEAEQAAKEEAEAAKIKAIIAEFLVQQKRGEDAAASEKPDDAGENQKQG